MTGYIKYSFVGAVGAVVNFTSLWFLTEKAHLWYFLAAVVGMILAATANYLLNLVFTFRDRQMHTASKMVGWSRFLLSVVPFDVVYLGLLYFMTSVLGMYYMLAAVISAMLMNVPKYILANKYLWKKEINLTKLETLEANIGK